jgi:peptidoglycan hydrolase-like protein with peptidoglycan-binding domain
MQKLRKLIVTSEYGQREFHLLTKDDINYTAPEPLLTFLNTTFEIIPIIPPPGDYEAIYQAILSEPTNHLLYADIISDTAFEDASMAAEEIQTFLDERDSLLAGYTFEDGRTVAQAISEACGTELNPRILITKLQVENSLIALKDPVELERKLPWALGVGCYDDGSRNEKYKGFSKQIIWAVKTFRKWFNEGKEKLTTTGVLKVKVKPGPKFLNCLNAATYSLFKYTPHTITQQDPASGGNYLFLKIFTNYFGVEALGGVTEAPPTVAPIPPPEVAGKYYDDENLHLTLGCMDKVAEERYGKTPNVPDNYVADLQEDLINLGFSVGSVGADGWFGPKTQSAVTEFQLSALTSKRLVNWELQEAQITYQGPADGVVKDNVAREIRLWLENGYRRWVGFIQPPDGLAEIKAAFGDPEFTPGSGDPYCPFNVSNEWRNANLKIFDTPHPKVNHIYCHRLIGPILQKVFAEIITAGLTEEIRTYNGCFCPRHKNHNPSKPMSVHSWGIAIDLNAATNGVGTDGDMHPGIVDIFERNGFTWGGRWTKPAKDPMHFQYCTGY